ncbi:MAG: hypothetical protein Ct9H90mP9_2090 [Pseudomonadota bacterium]|nr:MAG: hypothetical protein Ct9H90mP9_2090 [Pseudomonadota bacterium]
MGPSGPEGESEYQKLSETALSLEELDLGRQDPPLLSFQEARQFFLQQLEGMKVNRGHYLAEGVTLSSYLPMRPIPFKLVFLMGKGGRTFSGILPKGSSGSSPYTDSDAGNGGRKECQRTSNW